MPEIKIQRGQNLLDVALASAGSLEDLFNLANLNNLVITAELNPGEIILITGQTNYKESSAVVIPVRVSRQVTVMNGQTLLDLAIQETGSLMGLFDLALLNNLPVTYDLTEGNQLKYPSLATDRIIRKAYQDNGWKPASAKTKPGPKFPPPKLEGIDYWILEEDFVVQ